jgi:fumarate hydratase subunit alpha
MREISFSEIVSAVKDLCIRASIVLPPDVNAAIKKAAAEEASPLGRSILEKCVENASIAERESLPICQDTGYAVFFVKAGCDLKINGGLLTDAINEGTRQGYLEGYLRKSIVSDPLYDRKNTNDNTPALTHIEIVPGNSLTITLLPKGGGCENMSSLAMLKPSEGEKGVIDFVVSTVRKAGGNPCPPVIVGVGIGGTADKASLLAKEALLRPVGISNENENYAALEKKILLAVNDTGVGPQGLGGSTTALAVHVEYFPCHIASLPVAVNLNCHAARRATCVI